MNPKIIIRIVLLAVIAIAVGAWAMKEFGPAIAIATTGDNNAHADTNVAANTRPDGVSVINFHGDKRCRTCIGIGNLAKKTLDEEFAAEEKAGKIRWEHVNYDEAPNAHFINDYQLVSSTVLVTLWKDGKEVKWKRLDDVWDLIGEEAAFRAYIAQNVRDLLGQP